MTLAVPLLVDEAPRTSLPTSHPHALVELEAFAQDLQALKQELESSLGEEDLAHARKIERWGRACSVLGYATAWLMPNPVSALLIAQGNTARWTMMAHHVTHRGYDKVPGVPARYTGKRFATGWRRFLEWPDWIHPQAWRHEHNVLHHGHTGETADPDLVEMNTEWLRQSRMPLLAKYALVALFACTWKVTYYAPNTFLEWRRFERKRAGGPDEAGTLPLITAFNPFNAEGRAFWWTCLLPYAGLRFVLLPALFALLGAWAVLSVFANSVFAEVLTNIQSFVLIAPNHAGDDLYRFEGRARSGAEFSVRQVVDSVNYATGNDVVDFLHGWLNYQIEHHLWPSLPMTRYRQTQPRVKALCEKHGIPYAQESVFRRVKRLVDIMVGRTSMRAWGAAPRG
ncbi:fatty acid desaturase [Myxococcus sp. SDU36]|uniref:fatty acid desaturase family protein n=1 Tax=Myxococcus sp. SDU36 TaxID=2831967 RepID=UPI0025435C5F|nr:fatty acid desaturase [Myxococcus sp. SDU36]WIG97753.1 fatty acid desaturase [Myxococcus sp. SDU36]